MEHPPPNKLIVGEWLVDPTSGEISREGQTTRLEVRAMRLLLCLADLPGEVGAPAVEAYRETLGAAGIGLGTDWVAGVAAALAGWIVARGRTLTEVLDEDDMWGTTTMRPRLLAWLRNFIDRAGGDQSLPRLRAILGEMHDQLSSRWPEVRVPEYPALARPGSQPVPVPGWWPPRPGQKMDP